MRTENSTIYLTAGFTFRGEGKPAFFLQLLHRKRDTSARPGIRAEVKGGSQLWSIAVPKAFRLICLACLEDKLDGGTVILFIFIGRRLEVKIITGRKLDKAAALRNFDNRIRIQLHACGGFRTAFRYQGRRKRYQGCRLQAAGNAVKKPLPLTAHLLTERKIIMCFLRIHYKKLPCGLADNCNGAEGGRRLGLIVQIVFIFHLFLLLLPQIGVIMLYGILDKERNRSLAVAVARRRGAEQLFKGPCISLMAFIVRIQGDVKNVGIRFNQRFRACRHLYGPYIFLRRLIKKLLENTAGVPFGITGGRIQRIHAEIFVHTVFTDVILHPGGQLYFVPLHVLFSFIYQNNSVAVKNLDMDGQNLLYMYNKFGTSAIKHRRSQMNWFKNVKKSLLGRLVLSIMVIWIPFTVLVFGGLVILSSHLTKETINNQTDKVKYYSAIINADIERVMQSMYQMCGNKAIVEFTTHWRGQVDYESYLSYVEAYNTIKEYRNISMYIDDVFLYLPQSGEILSANSSIIPIDDIFLTMKESFEKDGVSFFHNNDALYYLSQGSNQVMVGIKISLLDIRYTLRGYDSEGSYDYFFVDSETKELLGRPENLSETGKQVYKRIDWESNESQEQVIGRNKYLIYRIGSNANKFLIIVYMNRADAYRTIYTLYWAWAATSVVLLLMPVFLTIVIKRIINRPMEKLSRAMQMVEQEKYNCKLELNESKEFNYVFEQYNRMTEKVRNLIQEVLEKQLQVEQARYKELQMQINPHFLFNSLYMGYHMAKSDDCEAVGDLCMYLGDYFSVLTFASNDFISVDNELKFINTYLKLNQMRFGRKLNFRIAMEEGLGDYTIPPLLLQPLIENSIMHGMEKCTHPCMITVEIHENNDELDFTVADDSGVITQDTIDKIRDIICLDKMPETYFGLWNIQNRLLRNGDCRKGLVLEKEDNGIFRVSFSIAKRRERYV